MSKAVIQLETVTCPSCIKKIEGAVSKIDGIKDVKVLFNLSKVKTHFDERKTSVVAIQETIEKLGYEVMQVKIS